MPSSAWMVTAVAGKVWSGVEVARMMRSMSSGASPASSSAARAARAPMDEVSSPSAAIRRSLMPVRSVIHRSDVSTSLARSLLVTTRSGRYPPHPLMTVLTILNVAYSQALSGTLELQFGVKASNVACQTFHHTVRRHVVGDIDGAGESGRVGSAVAFDDDAV